MDQRDGENGGKLRESLICAGEKLIGESGLEGVSLRGISAAAGTRNNYAVQYHFTDLDGLVHAIIAFRTPEIERRRRKALEELGVEESRSTRRLLDVFFRPLLEYVDEDGIPHFARFMNVLHRTSDGWRPLDDMFFMMPETERILDLLSSANTHIPAPVIWQRLRPISVMILTFACADPVIQGTKEYQENIQVSLLDMAAAALSVPVRETIASKVYGFLF